MKKFKKILLILLGTLGVLLVTIVGAVLWAFFNPEKAYRLAEKYVLPQDLKVTWSEISMTADRRSGLDFYIDWEIKDLLIKKDSPFVDVPLDHVHLKALIRPLDRQADLDLVQLLAAKTLQFKPNPSTEKKAEPGVGPFQQLQNIMSLLETSYRRVPLREVNIDVDRFELQSAENAVPLTFAAELKKSANSDPLNFVLGLSRSGEKPINANLKGELNIAKMNSSEAFLISNAQFKGFGVEAQQNISAVFQSKSATLKTEGQVLYAQGSLNLNTEPKLNVYLNPDQARLELFADIKGIPGPIAKVNGLTLTMDTPLSETGLFSEDPTKYKLKVPLELSFVRGAVRRELEKSCECELPFTIMGQSTGQIWLANVMSDNEKKLELVDAKISIDSMNNKLFMVDLNSDVKVEKEKGQYLISPVLNSRVAVYSLKGMHPLLQAFKVVVPAPLDVLDGKISFAAEGPVKRDDKGSHFPARLETALSSKKQKVNIQAESTVSVDSTFKKIHVEALARIFDLQVELPPLDPIKGNPRITKDQRILKTPPDPKPQKSAFEITFNFEVETAKPGSIRLLSEFFKPYLPLTLNFKLAKGDQNAGALQTEPFDVVYLRRRVKVEKMKLDLNQLENDIIPIDGRLRIQQTVYTVFIDIKGLIQEPTITMWSDPYLPESDIISVLLYDRIGDQLQSGDAETAGNVQAAMADKAIGLFGLWAFASTPIRSFSYNPVTKVYTATVELAGGVTAGIGTTWESTAQLELRKRVTRQWMLTARWNAATQDDDQNTELVLQWERRY